MFQSSSGLSTGCYSSYAPLPCSCGCFNPHPVFRPDATLLMRHSPALADVSILIRSFDRVLQQGILPPGPKRCSFNPHPAFRPDATKGSLIAISIGFNPHPVFRPDATLTAGYRGGRSSCFNPHPVFRPDATAQHNRSIGCQCEFQSSSGLSTGCYRLSKSGSLSSSVFQSSSGLSTGCYREGEGRRAGPGDVCFNPHPAFRPDATKMLRKLLMLYSCFNPHPAFRPDATLLCHGCAQHFRFNPHPVFRPDATVLGVALPVGQLFVSILIRSFDRMLPVQCAAPTAVSVRFNPHPAFRPDATSIDVMG